MLSFNDLRIGNKLRVLSLISIFSLLLLGYVSNYFFQTSKVLGVIINSERVQNNTFQAGVEDFYKFQLTRQPQLLDSALSKVSAANQMAYNFGIIDQLLELQKKEYIEIFYNTYKEGYNYDKSNAFLMANRLKLFLFIRKDKVGEAQQIAFKGYVLGEKIRKEMVAIKTDTGNVSSVSLENELVQMRGFYHEFANIISSLNSFANNLLFVGISLIVLFLLLSVILVSIYITKSIVTPVQEMVDKFRIIAKGNLNTSISINTANEIGDLANSFSEIQNGLLEVIEYTKKVASGDYGTQIKPRSDEDELNIALNIMVNKLKASYEQAEIDSWYKSGINKINEQLRGDQDLADISAHSLSFLMNFLHAQLGSIHLYNSEYEFLKLTAALGFDPQKLKDRIKLNDGIIGRAAYEKKMIVLEDFPDQTYLTYSSSGEYMPKKVIVVPLLFNQNLIGVLELSSVVDFSEIETQFLMQAAEIVAINLSSAVNLLKTNDLLLKTQNQASELQVQQEELRVANEELVEHTKVLTESEKRLQVQQEELRVANEELEERTRQLEIQKEDISNKNRELIDVRDRMELKAKELQMASQYKSEFLANMSHELRTPLNSLLILSNILSNNKKGNLTGEQVQSAKIIHKSGTDLLYLINEVLDLSKIEAGKMTIEISRVSTVDIKQEIVMNFEATALDKSIDFQVNVEENFPLVLVTDRYRLMQIIKNLLSNAFKFTSKGQVKVVFKPSTPNVKFSVSGLNYRNTCCINVIDTGVGIPEEKLDAIFEAFQQADGSISRKYGGTGLGLSISRELIKLLGGEIKLESKVNKGSSFFIYLPLEKVADKEYVGSDDDLRAVRLVQEFEDSPATSLVAETIVPVPFIDDDRDANIAERAVLIIHHSKQQAEKYVQQARSKNYRAIVAANIPDGILLAEKYHPKAIMLAVELANVKERNYLRLKNHPLVSKLPVHLISPIDFDETESQSGLKTLESIEFAEALKSLESHVASNAKRILLVEDDITTRTVVKELLGGLDIQIQEAGMAEEAYQIMCSKSFDCIILDLGLPDYSGKELLEKLKREKYILPKVIIYTGKEMSKEEIKMLSSYTDTIILKGLKSDERLMDEVTLFLHQVSKTIPEAKVKSTEMVDDKLFRGKKILVVDDEIRNVFALGKMLEEHDIEVFEAENGQVAIDILVENHEIDLVLMDVMMPVMDGYEAMRIIRNTPSIKHLPIICLTAKAMKEDHENALKHGANDYLSKPLSEEKLFAMLKIWLYKK